MRASVIAAVLLVNCALATSAGAAAPVEVTIGRADLTHVGSGSTVCQPMFSCVSLTVLPAVNVAPGVFSVPADGNVVAWRLMSETGAGCERLRVLRPSAAANSFTGAGTGATCATHLDGTDNTLTSSLPVQTGDRLGLDLVSNGSNAGVESNPDTGASELVWNPALTDFAGSGSPMSNPDFTPLMNATVQLDPPSISGLAPSSGLPAGGGSVVIAGAHLAHATQVRFGTATGTITANTNTEVTATAPALPAGTVDVTVTTIAGTSAANPAARYRAFSPLPPPAPVVTRVSPARGTDHGGTAVTILGRNLGAATVVRFGTTRARTFAGDGGRLLAVAPRHRAGTVDVRVTTPDGTSASARADHFTFLDRTRPRVTRLSVGPARFRAAHGTRVFLRLSERARLAVTLRRRAGRTSHAVHGVLRLTEGAGRHGFRLSGRFGGRTLSPGAYVLVARATDRAGNRSAAVHASFRILR